ARTSVLILQERRRDGVRQGSLELDELILELANAASIDQQVERDRRDDPDHGHDRERARRDPRPAPTERDPYGAEHEKHHAPGGGLREWVRLEEQGLRGPGERERADDDRDEWERAKDTKPFSCEWHSLL